MNRGLRQVVVTPDLDAMLDLLGKAPARQSFMRMRSRGRAIIQAAFVGGRRSSPRLMDCTMWACSEQCGAVATAGPHQCGMMTILPNGAGAGSLIGDALCPLQGPLVAS